MDKLEGPDEALGRRPWKELAEPPLAARPVVAMDMACGHGGVGGIGVAGLGRMPREEGGEGVPEPVADAAVPEGEVRGLLDFAAKLRVMEGSPHPGQRLRGWIETVASQLRSNPTIPCSPAGVPWTVLYLDKGVYLPNHHCPFEGCAWAGECLEALLEHVEEKHNSQAMKQALAAMGPVSRGNAAMSVRCEQGAPLVSAAHDRRCLKAFHGSISHPELQGLICFCCGCVHPHLPDGRCWAGSGVRKQRGGKKDRGFKGKTVELCRRVKP